VEEQGLHSRGQALGVLREGWAWGGFGIWVELTHLAASLKSGIVDLGYVHWCKGVCRSHL
jgi:hypothetical protein